MQDFIVQRACMRCGTPYWSHLINRAFRTHSGIDASKPWKRLICRPCEQKARDQRKQENRWTAKARDTVRRHAVRLEVSKEDLVAIYGWQPDRLAHDAEHQYGNGCNYCGHPYRDMGHGFADITLDIIDRSKAPHYRTNTKWCCQTCNRKKSILSPEEFEADLQVFALWTRHGQLPPDERGMLF